ncbi:MAG: radical SAM protein [Promethearchaeota archaeon]|jgi:pyruvate formate-lyase activating enzyme-like uncharacterized protein
MKKLKIIKSKESNFYIKGRGIPKGCRYCLKGQKTVLFLNGICQKPDHCSWYCPLSTKRKEKDVTFVNELEIITKDSLLEEVNRTDAKGMSITGGEPLSELNLNKTIDYIKYIKSHKGRKFHVHIYTNGINFDESIAKRLKQVGLDEIRFHPSKDHWPKIKFALNKRLDVGAEVPVIPNSEIEKDLQSFIIFLDEIGVDFINLNEFEYCFPNSQSLKNRGYTLKKGTVASVDNSQRTALALMKKLGDKISLKMHYCSTASKDYYQLKNRYIRRAKNIKLPLEVVTDEGLLLFGQIEGKTEDLEKFYNILVSDFKIERNFIIYKEKNIKLPYYISIDNQIISLIENFQLKGYIIEMTPFRKKRYQQITEKTPIELFKKEYGFNGS